MHLLYQHFLVSCTSLSKIKSTRYKYLIQIILNNLNFDKLYIQLVMILFLFSIIIVYPITLYPGFKIFEKIFITCKQNEKIYQNILRVTIVTITIVIGVTSINKFEVLMALCGSVVCTPLAIIIPPIMHYRLLNKKQSKLRNIIDICVAIIGTGISITVLVFTLINL